MEEIMDTDQCVITKQCYKIEEHLKDNVNILYNKFNNFVIFWNKYQIILYEDTNFEKPAKIIIPEYQIQCLLLSNNYLISLDWSSNIHLTSLKFKKVTQKLFKSSFHPRDNGVKAVAQMSMDVLLSLKIEDNFYYLNVHRLNQDFSLEKRVLLICKEILSHNTHNDIIMSCYTVTKSNMQLLQKVFNVEQNSRSDYFLIIITYDRKSLYALLFNPNIDCEEIPLIKLYTCPSEICNIHYTDEDLQMYVGLKIGTVIKISLTENSNKPDVIHLNTELSKIMVYNYNLLYTDCQTLWMAENINSDIKFKQLFVKNVKDFINIKELIICTTFTKLIYKFSIQNHNSFLNLELDEYSPAENVLNNTEYLQIILESVTKNEQLVKRLREEETYLTALALSNRQNLLDDVLKIEVFSYQNYIDVMKDNPDIILLEDISNYFAADVLLILISIRLSSIQHKLNNILQSIFDSSRVLITLSSENTTVKSASVKMKGENRNFKCLLPLEDSNDNRLNNIKLNLTIVTDIPGVFNEKSNVVTILYKKEIKSISTFKK